MSIKNLIFYGFLIFIPISFTAHFLGWGELVVFITAGLAILPLAGWMGTSTEEIAVVLGPSWGGLLNATFGNATELIIALIALNEGLVSVVKSSIVGSIISNLLLVLGLSMLLGGIKYKEQDFQPVMARVNASAMNLAVIAILLPTAVGFTSTTVPELTLQKLSDAVAVILIAVYGLTLLFSMKTHTYLYDVGTAEYAALPDEAASSPPTASDHDASDHDASDHDASDHAEHTPNLKIWIPVLVGATLIVAVESELLVNTLEAATEQLGLSSLFTGVILLPIIGNAAEHATAVTVAMKNKMELAVSVAVGSSMQIALFVAPILVLAGWLLDEPMDLNFDALELVAVAVAVLITNSISSDGRSNWLEGTLLLATYAILGFAFYFHPSIA
ncbi:calcium/proton exchanger [Halomicronema sp. CCY15110]|uniref:calcium/proton exchanger n=1 Tax=Halomicronema sp. CCY15110 TaxID=2767773 RepID=UPI0019519D87|nr:calcium/proton exchanger [Halomicronema sp. CCY15110]